MSGTTSAAAGRRLGNAEHAQHQPVADRQSAEHQRLAARVDGRQREPRALPGELFHQRRRIDLVADRRIAGDDHAGGDLDRQSAFGQRLRRRLALLVAERVALRQRGRAQFALRWLSPASLSARSAVIARQAPPAPAMPSSRDVGIVTRSSSQDALDRRSIMNGKQHENISAKPRDAVEALDPGVPYESRWAPYVRIHGPGQGQFPKGSIRPRGYMAPDARHSLAGPNVATIAARRQRVGRRNPRPCTARWQAPDADFKQPPHRHSGARLLARARNPSHTRAWPLGHSRKIINKTGFVLFCRECGKPQARWWLWIPGSPLRVAPE